MKLTKVIKSILRFVIREYDQIDDDWAIFISWAPPVAGVAIMAFTIVGQFMGIENPTFSQAIQCGFWNGLQTILYTGVLLWGGYLVIRAIVRLKEALIQWVKE